MGERINPAGSGDVSSAVSGSARDVVQARDISGGVHFHTHLARTVEQAPGPRQLPRTTAAFTGREAEVADLVALAAEAAAGRGVGTVVISAIDGMAGVGKTALALYVGHLLAESFPDGQLFVDLRGYTTGLDPRDPGDALAAILRAYGIAPGRIPADVDGRAALYRDRLAGTRTLIVLDDAAGEAQVRPLLPGAGGCLVVITSRRRLKALDDALPLPLDVLPLDDAVALLRAVVGPGHSGADSLLLEQVAELCGRLPLALRIAAALARYRPAWTLARLAAMLREGRPALVGFADTDRDLAAVFDLSYRALGEDHRLLFRRLGLLPGSEADAYAAAVLLDTSPVKAERLLSDLVDHSLLAEPSAGRYRMHDLLRLHARALADQDPADQRSLALERLLDYYQHTAHRAEALIARYSRPETAGPAPVHTPALADPQAARAWLHTERASLEACLALAAGRGWDGRVLALSANLTGLLRTDGPFPEAVALHTAALAAAERLDDRPGQADALVRLGAARAMTGEYQGAVRDLERALALHEDLGDRRGQANALAEAGIVRRLTGDHAGAVRALEQALDLYRELGDRPGQANALARLGAARALAGEYPDAVRDLEQTLVLYRGLRDQPGQANALAWLGLVRRVTGDYPGAARALEQAAQLHRHLGDRRGQADALTQLGMVRRAAGDHAGAVEALGQAMELQQGVGERLGRAVALAELGNVRRAAGDLAGAVAALEQALEFFRTTGSRGNEAWALNCYAAAVFAADDPARARALHLDALRLAREVHQPDDEALALEGIGHCLVRGGDTEGGAAHLNQAMEIFRRLGMRADAGRVHARLIRLDTS